MALNLGQIRYWELVSITRSQPDLISRIAARKPEWHSYAGYEQSGLETPVLHRRDVLDSWVDPTFAVAVLAEVGEVVYLSREGVLRSYSFAATEKPISVLEAFLTYGGRMIEDAFEYGSVDLRHA